MRCNVQEDIEQETEVENIPEIVPRNSVFVEVEPGKTLNINPDLSHSHSEKLLKVLRKHKEAFSWEYTDIQGILSDLCTHHIHIKEECQPIRQPQRRMNLALKKMVKDESQKLLDVGFIYLILESQWVSPLLIVPKKNPKWWIYVDYRELKKQLNKNIFPYPLLTNSLIHQPGRSYSPFWTDLVDRTRYKQILRIRKNYLHMPSGNLFLLSPSIWPL